MIPITKHWEGEFIYLNESNYYEHINNLLLMCRQQLRKDRKNEDLVTSKGPCDLYLKQNIIQSFEQNKLRNSEEEFIVALNIQLKLCTRARVKLSFKRER